MGRIFPCAVAAVCGLLVAGSASAQARSAAGASRQSVDDAWWTGPVLAASAATLPQGHLYVEPYLYDSLPYAHFDSRGGARGVERQNDFGSLTYVNYGLADGFTVGLIPRFGYDQVSRGASSAGVGIGDLSVQGQYRITQFRQGSWIPTIGLNVQETLPTGRYDRLDRSSEGFGAGAYTTTVSIYSQTYFWMPNGRILRTRLNLSYAASDQVGIDGLSVYGTPAGFQGRASPGASTYGDLAFEYSATRNWVAALDLWLEQDGNTRIRGFYPQPAGAGLTSFTAGSGVGRMLILAPAVEYNWSPRLGVIFGARIIAAGRNESASVTPVVALSYFH